MPYTKKTPIENYVEGSALAFYLISFCMEYVWETDYILKRTGDWLDISISYFKKGDADQCMLRLAEVKIIVR